MSNQSEISLTSTYLSAKSMFIIIVITLTILQEGNSITYASYPTLGQDYLTTFYYSSTDNIFIGSKRMESLSIVSGSNQAIFQLYYFNRSVGGSYQTKYILPSQTGKWKFIKSTTETLSCSIAWENTTSTIAFLQFSSENSKFSLLSKVTLQNLQNSLPDPYKSMPGNLLFSQLSLAESCDAFSIGDAIYLISSDNVTISTMPVPTGWKAADYTESFKYGITDSCLYKATSLSNSSSYQKIYTFDKYVKWSFKEYKGRIIATGSNATSSNPSGSNTFLQKIYVLQDSSSGISLIKSFSIDGSSPYQNIIPIYTSPKLTKLVYWNNPVGTNQGLHVKFKSVNYQNSLVYDMIIDNPVRFQTTFTGITDNEFYIGDSCMAMRNGSKGGSIQLQEAYQYIGNRVVFVDSRDINTMDDYYFVRSMIDPYFPYDVVVLNIFNPDAYPQYQVRNVKFGTYADRRRIIPPAITNYIQMSMTFFGKQRNDPKSLSWVSVFQSSTQTSLQFAAHNPSNPNKYDNSPSQTFSGLIEPAASAPYCRIAYDRLGISFSFIGFDASSTITYIPLDTKLTSAGISLNPATDRWFLARDCSKFGVKGGVFTWNTNDFTLQSNSASFIWTAADSLLKYVISGNSIWKYNPSSKTYVQYFNKTFSASSQKIDSYNNQIIVSSQDSSSTYNVQVIAYIDNGTTLIQVFNYDVSWDVAPNLETSDKLTKVAIFGSNGGKKTVHAYSIDYSQKKNTSIIFPMEGVQEEAGYTLIKLSEKFIYVRQLWNNDKAANDLSYTRYNRTASAYYLSQGTIPKLMFNKNITINQATQFKKALILSDDDGATYYLAAQTQENVNGDSTIIVRKTLLDSRLTETGNLAAYVSDNGVVLCSPGCTDCSTQTCTRCKYGYVLKTSSAECLPCGPGCTTCDDRDPLICTGCLNGTTLVSRRCVPCDNSCLTCNTAATYCTSCKSGFYYDATVTGKCKACPKNCNNCTSASTCLQCKKGFTLAPTGACRGCSIGCSDCKHDNITQCTACGSGLELVNSSCISCPKNCIDCSGGVCSKCLPGFSVNSAGGCRLNCQPPCASCEDDKPTVCKSCFSSATLTNGKCVYSDSCNTTGTCADCGQGLNVFFKDQYCLDCTLLGSIPNCLQCSKINTQACSICSDGYYLDYSGSCPQCPQNCTKCFSDTVCTSCSDGATLALGQTEGKCIACESPCLTCYGSTSQCLTCIAGFTKQGWKCLNDTHIDLVLTLSGTPANVLAAIDSVITSILQMLGESSTNVECVTISSIVAGSVVVTAVTSPITVPVATASSNLQTALADSSATVGGLAVASSSVTVDSGSSSNGGGGSGSAFSSTTSQLNVPLIIGVSVGAFVFVVLVVVGIVFCVKRSQSKTVGNIETGSRKPQRQMTVVQDIEDSKTGLDPVNSNTKIKLKP